MKIEKEKEGLVAEVQRLKAQCEIADSAIQNYVCHLPAFSCFSSPCLQLCMYVGTCAVMYVVICAVMCVVAYVVMYVVMYAVIYAVLYAVMCVVAHVEMYVVKYVVMYEYVCALYKVSLYRKVVVRVI